VNVGGGQYAHPIARIERHALNGLFRAPAEHFGHGFVGMDANTHPVAFAHRSARLHDDQIAVAKHRLHAVTVISTA
jgi:hypothetical protein